ncbi:MAG: SEL1-like repeat protein [Sphingomonadales bacterium]|nr:SEL1-like repeat protein [Sphingomonadales bacterium]
MASPALAQCENGSGNGTRGVALLVGISDYHAASGRDAGDHWGKLPNAVHDIDFVCEGFAKAGYRLFVLRDPDWTTMDATIADFHIAAMNAPSSVVYFAGHGFEYGGRQYVVPVDAPKKTERARLRADFIPLKSILDAAASAKEFSLFLMDACRTHAPVVQLADAPAGDLDSSPEAIGLFTVPRGAVIFSTISGRPAYDDAPAGAPQSPFAAAVAENMALPGLELSDFYENLHHDVVDLTEDMNPNGPQYPALYKVAQSKFYLVEPLAESAVEEAAAAPQGAAIPKLDLPSDQELSVEDGPVLIARVLKRNSLVNLTRAAEAGDPVAQYVLGYVYQHGTGAKKNAKKAQDWFEKSAAQGNAAGETALAYFLLTQPNPDQQRALALYRAAAAQGYAKAQSHLAFALWNGTLVPEDKDQALALFEQASQSGHVFATFALAQYSPERRPVAEQRLREIAAKGNAEGDNWLCELYYVDLNVAAVAGHCEKAALAGYPAARAIWAGMLARGDGTTRDDRQASYWAKLALTELDPVTRKTLYDYTAKFIR